MRLKLTITDTIEIPDAECIGKSIQDVITSYQEMNDAALIDPVEFLTDQAVIVFSENTVEKG